ncbi:hypothetical protein [Actinoalloteichus fjordicus]|uniref:Uncharacterized protein n=1 Tax=Actinoalloteichus fjordicus TaxID=1612552 RepID=A0AAC9LGJ2_9PSEU|nr:hypothetical protein [Actinoalloteichus fjordicus]APU15884.1 hypothetical protein UA74_19295 [Actinoalloteichus fjordicus]
MSVANGDVDLAIDMDSPVGLHPLVFLVDGDEVTIGRSDIDSYGIFPAEGADVVRRLADGQTPQAVQEWFERTHDTGIDMADLIGTLGELELLKAGDGESDTEPPPVRFVWLGRALFSLPALVTYACLIVWATAIAVARPELAPHYENIFFTEYFSVVQVTLFLVAIPLVLVHESFHALAGRRLGLRSRLRIGRRLYFVVMETSLDGLVAVPRTKRYLPILAGMLADVVGIAVCMIVADLTRESDGGLSGLGRFLLAVAFAALLRVVWQFFFYLRTDGYVLICTVLGCVDLHGAARRMLGNRVNRLLGRRDRILDESTLHPVDRHAARWYAWLVVGGYTVSLTTFVLAGAPVLYRIATGVLGRFGGDAPSAELLDSFVFACLVLIQAVLLGWLMLRDRRQARAARPTRHVIA